MTELPTLKISLLLKKLLVCSQIQHFPKYHSLLYDKDGKEDYSI